MQTRGSSAAVRECGHASAVEDDDREEAGTGMDQHPGFDLGARLKALRESHDLSQRELAKRAGVSNAIISMIEQNRSSPSVGLLKKLLDGFPISLAEFFAADLKPRPQIFFAANELVELAGGPVS